jgi:hypothetical protein
MSKKLTYEYVKSEIERRHQGCEVVSKEYINSTTKLDLICENNHNFWMNFNVIKNNNRWCPHCTKNKKLTIEDIEKHIKQIHPNAKLISTEYINSKEKLKFICEKGHEFEICWNSIQNHKCWCNICGGTKKHNYKYVKNFIENAHPGAELLSKEYKNTKEYLKIKCENGHIFKQKFITINAGHWCKKCGYIKAANKRKLTLNDVLVFLQETHPKSKLLSNTYKNNHSSLKIKCENNHIFNTNFNRLKNKIWCKYCAKNNKYTIEEIKDFIKNNHPKAKLLSTEYKNNKTKLKLICENNHKFEITFSNITQGHWCQTCSGYNKKTIKEIKNIIKSLHPNSKVISNTYKSSIDKLKIQCENNHIFSMSYNNIKNKHWCPDCSQKRKYTIKEVKNFIETKHPGSKLLSKIYINNNTKLQIICKNKHKFKMSFNSIKNSNQWCSFCAGNKRKTIKDIQLYIEKNHKNAKLLSSTYINSSKKLEILCENNHIFEMNWASISKGYWCPICSKKKKYTIEEVIDFINTKHPGAKLLSKIYKNCIEKLQFTCENGHSFEASFSSIKNCNSWCPVCVNKQKYTLKHVIDFINKTHPGAKVTSTKYVNSYSKLQFICKNGHIFKSSFSSIKNNKNWCLECSGLKKLDLKNIKKAILKKHPKSQLLSENYKNSKEKLKIKCENNHVFYVSWNNFCHNNWCPHCINFKSEAICTDIFEKLFGYSFIKKKHDWLINPKTGRKLELDGYCEELNIAFEYQGYQHYIYPNRYHSSKKQFLNQQNRDKLKQNICKEKGIILLTIKETDGKQISILKEIFKNLCENPKLLFFIKLSFLKQS